MTPYRIIKAKRFMFQLQPTDPQSR